MADPVFVHPAWVLERLNDESVISVDARAPFFFAQGHLPRAVSLPALFLDPGSETTLRGEAIEQRLGSARISRENELVVYDDGASTTAASLAWVLAYAGHRNVRILDGGITRWRHDGLEVTYDPAPSGRDVVYQSAEPDRSVLATLEDM